MRRIGAITAWLITAAGCGGASGEIHGHGGPVADWTLEPDRCTQPLGSWGAVADLYYAGVHAEDTEVVVRDIDHQRQVLVRIPGKNKMVVLRQGDCAVFDIGLGATAYTLNDAQGLTGHLRLDCTRSEIGHVTGSATFTCF